MPGHSPGLGSEEKGLGREGGKGGPTEPRLRLNTNANLIQIQPMRNRTFHQGFLRLIFFSPWKFVVKFFHMGENNFKNSNVFISLTTEYFFGLGFWFVFFFLQFVFSSLGGNVSCIRDIQNVAFEMYSVT